MGKHQTPDSDQVGVSDNRKLNLLEEQVMEFTIAQLKEKDLEELDVIFSEGFVMDGVTYSENNGPDFDLVMLILEDYQFKWECYSSGKKWFYVPGEDLSLVETIRCGFSWGNEVRVERRDPGYYFGYSTDCSQAL